MCSRSVFQVCLLEDQQVLKGGKCHDPSVNREVKVASLVYVLKFPVVNSILLTCGADWPMGCAVVYKAYNV
jgi:hypothetical protein